MNQEYFKGCRLLVVGGAGFVGSNLCYKLLEFKPKELIIVDNLLSADISRVPVGLNVTFHYGSITDPAILAKLPTDLDYAFHLATYHGNQSSMHDPLADHQNNTLTSLMLFNWIKDCPNLKKIVYSSAGCTVAQKTFDQAKPTTEEDSVSLFLDSPYQMSKIFGEFYGNYFFHQYRMPFVKARFQNVYGPGEILGAGNWRGTKHTVWRNVTPTFIFKSLHNVGLPLENNGIATRDFIYVDDIVEGLILCAINGVPGGVYNIASGEETAIANLAKMINAITGNSAALNIEPPRNWDRSGKRYAATDKAKQELGFSAKVNILEGLERTVLWTKANLPTIKACMAKHIRYVPELKDYMVQSNERVADVV